MHLPISVVSSETGIAKEVLRKWETRYGFPIPMRDETGNRVYSRDQLDRLKLISKLINDGMRPGQLVPLDAAPLAALYARTVTDTKPVANSPLIACLLERNPASVLAYLRAEVAQLGLEPFVCDLMPRMNAEVGDAWACEAIAVRDEHLYCAAVQKVVQEELARHAGAVRGPHVLLTTPPEELHTLGLLMVEAALTLKGANCVSLGAQSPLAEIVLATQEYGVQIVGLSFSASFPRRRIYPLLKELRAQLPAHVQVWVGGDGVVAAGKVPRGVVLIPSVTAAVTALENFRRRERRQTREHEYDQEREERQTRP